jgi:hypothetical protein
MAAFRFVSPRTTVVVGAVLLAALSRLIPHPPNFAPITAMALFGAATLTNRALAILMPLLSLLISDLCIEALHPSWGIYPGMWVTYAAFLIITLMGYLLRRRRTAPAIIAATLAGSVFFFVFTNFWVWVGSGRFPHTAEGLFACYVVAIPFFNNTLLGDAVYSTVLFGGFALAQRWLPALRDLPPVSAPSNVPA